jgi:hypothetical protein
MPFTPVASKAVVLGAGSVLSIGGPTGSTGTETFTPIGELTDFSLDSQTVAITNNTNFDSGQIVKKLGTLLDFGKLSGTMNFVPTNAGQMALLAARNSGVAYDFTLQLLPQPLWGETTTGRLYAISGIVTEAGGFDLSQTKVSQGKFTIDINSITVTPGA